ncbi:MAG: TetR/AcrR family transcriptional regulator [Arenicellales bacterium]|jgi:AcrR family transcriptional regulator
MPTKKSGKRQPSQRVSRKRERSRQEILEAAREILREGGVEAVTLGSVAGKLGLTKQALYHYFPSKEALVRSLVVTLLDEEVGVLVAAVEREESDARVLGALIRAFYRHYIGRLDAFRAVYCQSQLYPVSAAILDADVLRDEINPRTRGLFDILETRLAKSSASKVERARKRRLAYTAWLAALGLLTMLGVADATRDALVHADEDLLDTLVGVFDSAAGT